MGESCGVFFVDVEGGTKGMEGEVVRVRHRKRNPVDSIAQKVNLRNYLSMSHPFYFTGFALLDVQCSKK